VFTEIKPPAAGALLERAEGALTAALEALFLKQNEGGHWCAELEGDSILYSEYLLMKAILGHDVPPEASPDDVRRFRKARQTMRALQREDGSWGQYPGAPADLSATVKAYFAVKLWGESTDAPHMVRARRLILEMGGAEKINTFSMFYLACLGQVPWDACPIIPPQAALLPRWSPFHLDKVAAWTRTMILPLALCSALRPVRALPPERGIGELFNDRTRCNRLAKAWNRARPASWHNFFIALDRVIKWLDKRRLMPARGRGIRAAERWLLERMEGATTDGLGAIFPPMVYIQVALQRLGYPRSHAVVQRAERELDRFIVEPPGDGALRIQPCFSPVWDTGIALYAVTEAGLIAAGDGRVARACKWLCEREVARIGDWINNLRRRDRSMRMGPGGDAGAWAFEYRNDWYPDVDDTAMVAMSLRRAGDEAGSTMTRDASARGVRWLLAMQNDDGGWAAFDRTKHRQWMEAVPFADHNAMQDPSCADITGRTLEALITCGVAPTAPGVRAGIGFLRRTQRPRGCWWGRWGCNFIYGTWQAVGGLIAAGEDPRGEYLQRTLAWLRSIQNEDGGFGESANSYLDESLMGRGPSTASQTAWALISMMNLLGADAARDESVQRAVEYLLGTQLREPAPAEYPEHPLDEPAGSWRERWFTGTGFPRVFYLRYHLYRHYFPVMALARFVRLVRRA